MLDKCLSDRAAQVSKELYNNRIVTIYRWDTIEYFISVIEHCPVTERSLNHLVNTYGLPDRWGFSHPIGIK